MFLLTGCGSTAPQRPNDGRLPVCAGIPPLAYLVEQIGGEHVKVDVLVQPGQDPHTFEPTPRQIHAIGKATIFFKIDMPFEAVLLKKLQEGNRRLTIVDTTEGIKKRTSENPGCEHSAGCGAPDPHVWLSPPLLKILAKNIATALCQADPKHRHDCEHNLGVLNRRLDLLHERIQEMLAPYRGRSFYVFHPGFGYFADVYGLKEAAVETAGREPTPQRLALLIQKARTDGVKTIFTQPQLASSSAQVIADAIGGKVAMLNGLDKNVIGDIEDIAEKVESAFKQGARQRHGEKQGN